MLNSNNIVLDHLDVHGSLDGNAWNDVAAFLIRNSSTVTVSNSEFQQLRFGLGILNNDHLTISGDNFHDIREDGIRGGGNNNVLITGNTFANFHPNWAAGDHPDAVQFWTSGTTAPTHDITVTNNVIDRGTGGSMQGVFLRDEVGNLHYQHVDISGNLLIGSAWNGVTVQGGLYLNIGDNILSSFSDQDSRVRIEDSTHVAISNNQLASIVNTNNADISIVGNHVIGVASDGGAAIAKAWALVGGLDLTSLLTDLNGGVDLSGGSATAGPMTLNGGAGADTLSGGGGNDHIYGNDGNDSLLGGAAADGLEGRAGNDTLDGGDGSDLLYGGAGNNLLTGGNGADSFVFRNTDFVGGLANSKSVITDFSEADHDVINLNMVDANGGTSANEAFTFIGNAAFHGVAGELRYDVVGADTVIVGDINGDGAADFQITLQGVTSIKSTDFGL